MIDVTEVSYSTVSRGDESRSSLIYTSSGFNFGTTTYYYAYVSLSGTLCLVSRHWMNTTDILFPVYS